MYLDTNNGWFARWREHRRVERLQACERERRKQEQLDQLLADYPVDRSPHAKTRANSNRGLAGHVSVRVQVPGRFAGVFGLGA